MGTGSADDQKTFIEEVVPWLEQQDYVQRYAASGEPSRSALSCSALTLISCAGDFANNPIANFVTTAGVLFLLGQAYSDTT
jgi:hypothetical protein